LEAKQVVLIVDDDRSVTELLSALLKKSGYRTIGAKNGKQAVSLASSHCPDLILLALNLPDIDGLAVLQQLRAWCSIPVIVVSARPQEVDKIAALDAGADDFVAKPFGTGELLARIRAVLRRNGQNKNALNKPVFSVGDLLIDYTRRMVVVRGNTLHLTPIEYRLLTLLSLNAGRVMPHERILGELWGPYIKDNRVVRVNIANIRRKLEQNPAEPQYILTEAGVGYRMTEGK
jgi:Response regulators consisting of a CheY-like receiver domain and a winged-helix DNA-binding domain